MRYAGVACGELPREWQTSVVVFQVQGINLWCLTNDLQLLRGQFTAENEAARVKISFSKFENMGPPQLERTVGFVYQSI